MGPVHHRNEHDGDQPWRQPQAQQEPAKQRKCYVEQITHSRLMFELA